MGKLLRGLGSTAVFILQKVWNAMGERKEVFCKWLSLLAGQEVLASIWGGRVVLEKEGKSKRKLSTKHKFACLKKSLSLTPI